MPAMTSTGVHAHGTKSGGEKKKSRKVRKLKDPEAPKRGTSSFLLFAREERSKILADVGAISVGEMGKELGRRWGRLGEEERDRFNQMARKDSERYREEMKTYQPSELFLQKKAASAKIVVDAPAPAMEEYFQFLSTRWRNVSSAHPGLAPVHVQDLVWQEWVTGRSGLTGVEQTGSRKNEGKTGRRKVIGGQTNNKVGGAKDSPWMVEEEGMDEVAFVKDKMKVRRDNRVREM